MEKIDFRKQSIPFTQVANGVLNDPKLSFSAKGLYAYLYSKPEGWYFSTIRMTEDSADGKFKIREGLKELEDSGYLFRQKLPSGRILYTVIYPPDPETKKWTLGIDPESNKPTVQKTHSAKTGLISNKELLSNKDEESNKEIVAEATEEFSLTREIQKMEDSPRRDMNIIALYLERKKPDIRSKDQLSVAIKRHLRPAKQLTSFDDGQILSGCDKAQKQTPEWTLETIVKMLTK